MPTKPVLHVLYIPKEEDPYGILDGDDLEGHPPFTRRRAAGWYRARPGYAQGLIVLWQGVLPGELSVSRMLSRVARDVIGIGEGEYAHYGVVRWLQVEADPYKWKLEWDEGVVVFDHKMVPGLRNPPGLPVGPLRAWALTHVCAFVLGGQALVIR